MDKLFTDSNVYNRGCLISKMTKAKLRYRLEAMMSAIVQATSGLFLSDVEENILDLQLNKIKNIICRKRCVGSKVVEVVLCIRKF